MNAERLLQHYEQIADAPDAIARLRRFILDLAVRGKLVPQDSADEPASELLKRIAKERVDLRVSDGGKRIIRTASISAEEYPFALPGSWVWSRLGDVVTKLTDGTHHSPDNGPVGEFKYITAKNIKDHGVSLDQVTYVASDVHAEIFSRCNPEKGDILYIKDGATTGVVTVNDLEEPFSMLSSVALLKLSRGIFNRLLVAFLRSPFFYDQMRGFMKGAAITRVTLKRMAPALVPVPPLAEQHRIVAKVDELMTLCDELEAARTERETKRDRLAAASLARLNSPNPETFRDDARFALDTLPALTARPDQIKQLRQTILNLAVRGKLVPQDPADEPAEALLKRMAGKKSDKGRGRDLRRNGLPDAVRRKEEELAPRNWTWCQLNEIALSMRYGTSVKCDYGTKGAPVLRIPNVSGGRLSLDDLKFGPLSPSEIADLSLLTGDILLIRSNGSLEIVGRSAVVTPDAEGMSFAGYLVRLRTDPTEVDPDYIWIALQSSDVRNQIEQPIRSAVGLKNVNLTEFGALTFRLPPLAEQHRIIAKIGELMALCDQLEVSLTSADETRKKLLDALLAEALAPVDDNRLQEAAE